MRRAKRKPGETAIVKAEDTLEYWKARALAAEERICQFQNAFELIMSLYKDFIEKRVEQMVDEFLDTVNVETYLSR